MRLFEDKLIYKLNISLPTSSIKARTDSNPEVCWKRHCHANFYFLEPQTPTLNFQANCKGLFESLKTNSASRGEMLNNCVTSTALEVSRLRKERENNDGKEIDKQFKSEQRKVNKFEK